MSLRNKLIRLAHSKPELRKHLLPLLKESSDNDWWEQSEKGLYRSVVPLLEKAVKRIRGVNNTEKLWENAVGVSFYNELNGLYYYLWIPTPSAGTVYESVVLQYTKDMGDIVHGQAFYGPAMNEGLSGDWKSDERTIIDFVAKSLKKKHNLY